MSPLTKKASPPLSHRPSLEHQTRREDGERAKSGENNASRNGPGDPTEGRASGPTMKIAVIGFGMMGRQIAQVFAQNGFEVMATDEKEEMLRAGLEEIEEGAYGIRGTGSPGELPSEEAKKA